MRQILLLYLVLCFTTVFAQKHSKLDTLIVQTSARCGMCKERIESNLAFEKGVKDVRLDLKTKQVTIVYRKDKTTPDLLRTAISNIGYDADHIPANKEAYDRLPACCKKDAPEH